MDVITTVNYIQGFNPQPFCFENADLNGDGSVNAIDVIGTVNIIITGGVFDCDVSFIYDTDGNYYNTVLIGEQCWMKENLKTTKYRNGTPIENPTNNSGWQNNTIGAYAWYDNDISWKDSYGALYNWHAVKSIHGLCPNGWHVPTDAEFTTLTNYLGSLNVAGGKMKSPRTVPDPHPRWESPNIGATNESGFTGFSAGWRFSNGEFNYLGYIGYWWTSSSYSIYSAYNRYIYFNGISVYRDFFSKADGYAVRCLKD
jgi:uncharacterized protein (TIGR02145 family)